MKILFVYPPPFEDKIFSNLVYPPLGILFLASVVREMGHDVKVFDANVLRASFEETVNYIKEIKPDIVGITAATANGPSTFKLAAKIKEIEPSVKIISGGPHITVAPEECLNDENIDYILVGEGEATIKELIEALESGSDPNKVKGIGFRKGKKYS